MTLSLSSYSHNFIIGRDIVCNELVGHYISIYMHRGGAGAVSTILYHLVVVTRPEEWHRAIWNEFAEHVESGKGSLIKRDIPVLGSGALSVDPVGVGSDITCSKDIFIAALQERITGDTAVCLQLDI